MDGHLSPNEAHWDKQLCVLSCQGGDVAYSWSLIDGRLRDAVGFRGYSAKFQAATTAREVLDFTVQGPLFSCVAGLQDVVQMQELDIGGSIGTPPNIVPFAVKNSRGASAADRSRRPSSARRRAVDQERDRGRYGRDHRRHSSRRGLAVCDPGGGDRGGCGQRRPGVDRPVDVRRQPWKHRGDDNPPDRHPHDQQAVRRGARACRDRRVETARDARLPHQHGEAAAPKAAG